MSGWCMASALRVAREGPWLAQTSTVHWVLVWLGCCWGPSVWACPYMAFTWCGQAERESERPGVSSCSHKDTHPNPLGPSSPSHLDPVAPQRPRLPVLSHWGLGSNTGSLEQHLVCSRGFQLLAGSGLHSNAQQ